MKRAYLLSTGLLAISLVFTFGCGEAHDAAHDAADSAVDAVHDAADDAVDTAADVHAAVLGEHEHNVVCGCSVEDIGACGNYIQVDEQLVELVLPEDNDLGEMPFCGQSDLVASVQGEMQDGKFVATSFEYKN